MNIAELRTTAELARLELDDDELKQAFAAFEQMLDYFSAMQDADSLLDSDEEHSRTNIEAGAGYFRSDVVCETALAGPQSMIEKASEQDGKFIMIPNVL